MNVTRFNEQEYEYEIYLDNSEGVNTFNINPAAIVSLDIEHTLADWVTRGSLTIFYAFEAIENKPNTPGELGDSGNNYIFKNDGSDTLYIRIFPRLDALEELEVNRNHWELVYKFAIYDVEDINSPPGAQNAAGNSMKCKKFYFWDRMYQRMISNYMEYSTGLSTDPRKDSDRAIPTGVAMREIIEKALVRDGNSFFDLPYSTSLVGGSDNTWDDGDAKIFYTAPVSTTAYESLMYIYSKHVSSNKKRLIAPTSGPRGGKFLKNSLNDFCILQKEQGPSTEKGDEGYFVLRPVAEYFKKAGTSEPGEFQIEHFYLQGYTPEVPNINPKIAPDSKEQNLQIDTKLGSYSLITEYQFVDISPFTNTTDFCSYVVHSFDFDKRVFNIEFEQNSIESARKFIASQYITNVRTKNNTEKEGLFLLNIDNFKLTNKNIKHVYDLDGGVDRTTDRQAKGLQKLLQTGLFQNACINFRVPGSTNRKPGRFIAIDKQEGVDENAFNYKFFGQWFIINVKLLFEGGAFVNEITAVKLHKFALT
jgi:hypothetical protein